MAYNVSTADIEARWRPLSDSETDVATQLLADAEMLLNAQIPALPLAVIAETVPAELVTQTLVAMVKRVLVNPDMDRSFGIEGLSGASLSSGELYVSAIERATLQSALAPTSSGGGVTGRVGSVRFAAPWYAT